MTLIDGDRIITAQLYDDEHEEFIEKKMSIIDYINAYTDEGITEADVIEQTGWIPVSERLPEANRAVLTYIDTGATRIYCLAYWNNACEAWEEWVGNDLIEQERDYKVIAWMPLPEPYKEETKIKQALAYSDQDTMMPAT